MLGGVPQVPKIDRMVEAIKEIMVALWFIYYVPTQACIEKYRGAVEARRKAPMVELLQPGDPLMSATGPRPYMSLQDNPFVRPEPKPDPCYDLYVGSITATAELAAPSPQEKPQ